jgi:hypothetical protein
MQRFLSVKHGAYFKTTNTPNLSSEAAMGTYASSQNCHADNIGLPQGFVMMIMLM